MSRIEFLKAEKWRVLVLVLLAASLPFMRDWHNPAGLPPVAIFGTIAALGWFGLIGWLLAPASWRAEYFRK